MRIDVRARQSAVLHLLVNDIAVGTKSIARVMLLRRALKRLDTPEATIDAACEFGLTLLKRRRCGTLTDAGQRYDL